MGWQAGAGAKPATKPPTRFGLRAAVSQGGRFGGFRAELQKPYACTFGTDTYRIYRKARLRFPRLRFLSYRGARHRVAGW